MLPTFYSDSSAIDHIFADYRNCGTDTYLYGWLSDLHNLECNGISDGPDHIFLVSDNFNNPDRLDSNSTLRKDLKPIQIELLTWKAQIFL